ncbi:MAG: MerR family transcriptional regulator [Lachnospiraceae bacterium]|nr:MerR family transcriptional regulator [Lachnospiraceae bacterium]
MFYTVIEVSQKTGLSPHTIRYYLKEGLFPSIKRDARGTRLFSQTDIETFYMIECMKRCGMTISEIRQYMAWLAEGDQNIEKCLNLFLKKQQVLAEELQKMKECVDAVEYKVWYYEKAKEAGTLSVHDTMRKEDIPEKMQTIRSRMSHVKRLTAEELS